MALYTQFQDPAQYYLRKEERRDESMRNAMAMMMQMKMQQREWGRQNKLDELSERRVSAYEKSIEDQNSESQKQWQARWAAIDQMYPPGSRENMALKAGMSLNDIESNFYPESTIGTLTDWSKMTRSEWDNLSPGVKRQYFNRYYSEQNADTMAGYRDKTQQKSSDKSLAGSVKEALDYMAGTVKTKFKDYIDTGGGNPMNDALEQIAKARLEVSKFVADVENGSPTVEDSRKKMYKYLDERIMKDAWYWVPQEKRDAYMKGPSGSSGRNNLAKPGPEQIASNPAIDVKREVIGGAYVDKPASAVKAIAASMGKDPASVVVDDKTMPGYGLVALGGKTYRFPL